MKVEYPDFEVNYLSVLGKLLTASTINFSANEITGPLSATTSTDWKGKPNFRELAVNFTVGGVTGSFQISFVVLDPVEGRAVATVNLTSSPISTSNHQIRLTICGGVATVWVDDAPTLLGNMMVPARWQCNIALSGTAPRVAIDGTYEARA